MKKERIKIEVTFKTQKEKDKILKMAEKIGLSASSYMKFKALQK